MPPRFIYITSSHQYPLGAMMNLECRLSLTQHTCIVGVWIIEDDYDNESRHTDMPLSAIQGLTKDAPVTHLDTFSKTLFPALRLNYMVMPPAPVSAPKKTAGALMLRGRVAEQLTPAEFIEAGHFTRHLRRMRRLHGEHRDALQAATGRHLDGIVTISGGARGMRLSTRLDAPVPDTEVSRAAHAYEMVLWPLSRFCLPGVLTAQCNGLVLSHGSVPAGAIDRLMKRMRDVIGNVGG